MSYKELLQNFDDRFQVGNEMINNGMKKVKILLYILTLGFITPIGIIVGLVLTLDAETALDPTQSVAVGVLQVDQIRFSIFSERPKLD